MALAAVRARVGETRAAGGEALAIALVELAEYEPLFGHRQAVVRAPLEEAATLLDQLDAPALQGRVLLRLAHVKLADGDLEAVEQLAARAGDRLEADPDRLIEASTLLARASIRRKDFEGAQARLIATSERMGDEPTTLAGRRAAVGLALGWAELALEQEQLADADERYGVLVAGTAGDGDDLVEIAFASRQARGLIAMTLGDPTRACPPLRDAVSIAKRVGGLEDELEVRIALAGALVQRDDQAGREEAERHLQIARDQAIEHDLDSMHMAALLGQVGLLAQKGQTQGALDRCVEIAQAAVSKRDLPRYGSAVALMSGIYEQRGDLASAYRTFAEAHATLKESAGDLATDLFRPHLAAFSERIGPETFREIAEKVNKAAHARQTFRRRS